MNDFLVGSSLRLGAVAMAAVLLASCADNNNAANTMNASASLAGTQSTTTNKAGVTPLGDASLENKTERPSTDAQLLVTGVRVGQHDGFNRVVFDLEGTGTPGWFVDYTATPSQQGSGNPIPYMGDIALNVNIDGVTYPFEVGKEDPNLGTVPGAGGIVTEVKSVGTFEGRAQFVVGISGAKAPFSVSVLKEPTRLVVDIRKP